MIETLDDLYKYRKEAGEILPKIDNILSYLDDNTSCKFRRPYSANAYWFVITFLDMIMKNNFTVDYEKSVSINDLYFNSILGNGRIKTANLYIIPETIKDKIKKIKNLKYRMRPVNKNIVVVQDGYEVAIIKDHLKEYKFFDAILTIKVGEKAKIFYEFLNDDKQHELKDILKTISYYNISFVSSLISFFYWYNKNVISYLDYFYFFYQSQLRQFNPFALFYSIGPNTVLEEMYAKVAYDMGIPIFCFQHTGDRRHAVNPLVSYFEREKFGDVKVNRIDIEKFGSAKLYNFYKNKITNKKKNGKALFICSSPLESAKEHLLNVSANMQKRGHIDILNYCVEKKIKLDIKLHPINEKEQRKYFEGLLHGVEGVKILRKKKAENIIDDYSTIIFDFVQSAATDPALLSNAEIIFFLQDKSVLVDKTGIFSRGYWKGNKYFIKLNDIEKKRIYGGMYFFGNPTGVITEKIRAILN